MNIHATLTRDDVAKAQASISGVHPIFYVGTSIAVLFGIIIAIRQYLALPMYQRLAGPKIILAGIVGAVVVQLILPRIMARWSMSRQVTLDLPFEAEITTYGMTTTNARGTHELKWDTCRRYRVFRETILVYPNRGPHLILPRRWFSNTDYKTLLNYMRENFGDPAE